MSVSLAEVENNQNICPHRINIESTRCSDHSGIPDRLGKYWEQGLAARDVKLKPWATVSDTQKSSVWCLRSHWKNEIKVFFSPCLFFSHSVSRGRLFHHPAGNLHGEGMHTQEYCCLLWELPLVGASLKYSVQVSLLCQRVFILIFTPLCESVNQPLELD